MCFLHVTAAQIFFYCNISNKANSYSLFGSKKNGPRKRLPRPHQTSNARPLAFTCPHEPLAPHTRSRWGQWASEAPPCPLPLGALTGAAATRLEPPRGTMRCPAQPPNKLSLSTEVAIKLGYYEPNVCFIIY